MGDFRSQQQPTLLKLTKLRALPHGYPQLLVCVYRTGYDINTKHARQLGNAPLFFKSPKITPSHAFHIPSHRQISPSLPLIAARTISPINLPTHIPNLIELRANLHHRVANHARVQTESPLDGVLCLCARVEAHDEVVAVVVGCALLAGGFGEEESAPVCDAADDAAGGEDLVACCAGDSGNHWVRGVRTW